MRFIDRTLNAIRYYAWGYLGEWIAAFLFCIASVVVLTARHAADQMEQNFSSQLNQLDPQAVSKAKALVAAVRAAYSATSTQYLIWFGGLIGGATLAAFLFASWFAHRRREESAAYLTIGKNIGEVAGQYVLESALVFLTAYALVWLIGLLIGATASSWIEGLAKASFSTQLERHLAGTSVVKDLGQLMHQHLTSFNGPGLLAPGQAHPLKMGFGLAGSLWTLAAGLGALVLGAGTATLLQLSLLKHQLQKHA